MDLKTYTTHLCNLQSTNIFLRMVGHTSLATRRSLIDIANTSVKHLEIGMKVDGYTPSADVDSCIAAIKGCTQTILPGVATGKSEAWAWHLAALYTLTEHLIKDVKIDR